jgi:hypothetical protein
MGAEGSKYEGPIQMGPPKLEKGFVECFNR